MTGIVPHNNKCLTGARSYFEAIHYANPDAPATKRYTTSKLKLIDEYLRFDKEMSVLDVGCGNGIFSVRLQERVGMVVGADLSKHLLRLNPLPHKLESDATALPCRDASFDVVFEANLLHHVKERERVISEMLRVTRRHVVFVEPNAWNPLMFAFGLVSWVERGSLVFTPCYVRSLLDSCNVRLDGLFATGMITQNHTPAFLIPILGIFDFKFPLGEYIVAVGHK